jgi:hypothetical protein
MAITAIRLIHINTQRVNIPFTVVGHFELDDEISAATIEYSDDVNTARPAAPTIVSNGEAKFSFVHPGYAEVARHTLTISLANGVSVKSNPFDVVSK